MSMLWSAKNKTMFKSEQRQSDKVNKVNGMMLDGIDAHRVPPRENMMLSVFRKHENNHDFARIQTHRGVAV